MDAGSVAGAWFHLIQAEKQDRLGPNRNLDPEGAVEVPLVLEDLRALLGDPGDLPIHYPRPSNAPDPDGKNFEWFVGNKRDGRNAGPHLTLPYAKEDDEGLPLIDKFGRILD